MAFSYLLNFIIGLQTATPNYIINYIKGGVKKLSTERRANGSPGVVLSWFTLNIWVLDGTYRLRTNLMCLLS